MRRLLTAAVVAMCTMAATAKQAQTTATTATAEQPRRTATATTPAAATTASPREVRLMNFGWHFHAGDLDSSKPVDLSDKSWRTVDLPHDFQIEQPWVAPTADERPDNSDPGANIKSRLSGRGFKEMGVGWYMLTFTPDEAWRGRRVVLDFEGILLVADAWLNGEPIGKTDYGYLGFETDVSRLLKWGEENVVAVRADTRDASNSRWYTGAGIYRDVHIVVTDPDLYFTRNALRITTDGEHTVSILAEVSKQLTAAERQQKGPKTVAIRTRITDAEGLTVAERTDSLPYRSNQATREYELPPFRIDEPRLWDTESPYLYTAELTLLRSDGSEADRVTERFGVRRVEFGPDFGMKLNGKKVILKGIANHHTLGALGAAAYPRAIEKRLRMLKSFGFNHIRTSHNPYSKSLLDLCDELGILVVDELYDKWLKQYAGGRVAWTELWQHDIPEWIGRDRNHPSVVMWSLGNELQTYWKIPFADWGVTPYRMQKQLLLRYDTTRPITVAMHPRGRALETDSLPASLVMETDIASYNYRYMYFPGDGRRFPWMTFYQSEATTSNLGPNYYEMELDKVIGLAYWGVIDYLGESQGWPAKGWAQGFWHIDLTPKPTAYLARAIFADNEPVCHICINEGNTDIEWNGVKQRIRRLTDHWTRSEGDEVWLTVYTNADEVELLVNGRSIATKQNDRNNPKTRNQVSFGKVKYEAGCIEAVARTAGKVVATHRVETAGEAVALRLVADLPTTAKDAARRQAANALPPTSLPQVWTADGTDLEHVTVQAVDAKGRVVPGTAAEVTFSVEGEATLAAVSSGDHYSDELTQTDHRRLFYGQAIAILRSTRTPGAVTLTATAPGLKSATLKMQTSR